jgi:hypothetical protein
MLRKNLFKFKTESKTNEEKKNYFVDSIEQKNMDLFAKFIEYYNMDRRKKRRFKCWNIISCASKVNNSEVFDVLVILGADINETDDYGDCAIHEACSVGFEQIFDNLIELGADINKRNKSGFTPLHYAIESKSINIFSKLIRLGADIHVSNKANFHGLHMACNNNSFEIMEKMIIPLPLETGCKPCGLLVHEFTCTRSTRFYLFMVLLVHGLLVHGLLVHGFTCSRICLFTDLLVHGFTCSRICLFTDLLVHGKPTYNFLFGYIKQNLPY